MTEFSEITGPAMLATVPNMNVRHPVDADASGVMFTLDNRTYLIFEDPSDGYRSSAGPILSFDGDVYSLGGNDNHPIYINEPVICRHAVSGEYGSTDDILELISVETGNVVFRVGTFNTDDYYPSFKCEWSPENLSVNAKTRAHD